MGNCCKLYNLYTRLDLWRPLLYKDTATRHILDRMSFSKEICQSFFDYKFKLNKGHDVVPAIYKLILRKRELYPAYFASIESRLERATFYTTKRCEFFDVLETSLNSINLKSNKLLDDDEWLCVACAFFIAEWIVRRSQCHSTFEEHMIFEKNVIDLLEAKIKEFGITTSEQWYFMVLTQNRRTIRPYKESPLDFTPYAIGALLLYLVQKI